MTSSNTGNGSSPHEPGRFQHEPKTTQRPSPADESPPSKSSPRGWLLVLGAALIAGLASFAIGEAAPTWVRPSTELSPEIRADRNQVPIVLQGRKQRSEDLAAAIAYGGLGMLLGLGLGTAGCLVRGRAAAAPIAGLCGLVLGALAGAGGTTLILPRYHAARGASNDDNINLDVAMALATHGGIWLLIGAAGGLALGLGLGGGARVPRALIGGMLGAALAAVVYEFAGAVVFPLAQTFRPIAKTLPPRLMAHVLVALGTASMALWAVYNLRLGRSSPKSSSESTPIV